MSDPILPLLLGIVCVLLALGAAAAFMMRAARQVVGFAGAAVAGLGVLLSLVALALGQDPVLITLPFGPPGLPLQASLDPLAGYFLFLVFLSGTASMAFTAEAAETAPAAPATLAGNTCCLAGLVLTVVAADGVTLALGVVLSGAALWATGEAGRPRAVQLGMSLMAALILLIAAALPGLNFAAIRAHAGLTNMLACVGAAALIGLVPFQAWIIPAYRATPARGAALMSGAAQPVAIYLLLRFLLDLSAAAPPLWWSIVLLAGGAVSAAWGAWRAAMEPDIDSCLAAAALRQAGVSVIGVGFALLGRSFDLPALTALSLGGVLLLSLAQALCGTLAHLAAGGVRLGAGSRRLALLGGLIHPMPVVTFGMGAGLMGLSALPFGPGYAGLWLVMQAFLATPRSAGWPLSLGLGVVAVALTLTAALSVAGLIRLFGVVFLGRPRGPRAAGAVDVLPGARPVLLVLAGLSVLVGVFPGAVLVSLGNPVIRALTHDGFGPHAGLLGVVPAVNAGGYLAAPLAGLLVVSLGVLLAVARRHPGPSPRLTPAWNGGFAPPPAWLPFGESLTQTSGAGFVPDLPSGDEWTSSCARAPLSLVKTVVNTRTSWEMARKASPLWLLLAALTTMLGALALR